MVERKGFGAHLWLGPWGKFIVFLAILLLTSACSPGAKSDEDLRREIQDLKKEVKAMSEKLEKLQAGQQALLEIVKKPGTAPEAAAAPPQPPPALQPPPVPKPLTVSQLLAGKDQYLGTRVTVRGPVGPVLVHHKSLILKAPEGMVEVFFGKIADQKLVQYLTSASLEQSVTVTGIVNLPPKAGATKLQINADSIDF